MYKLTIVTVAFNNLEGIKKTHNSLSIIQDVDKDLIEWVVVDGNSSDGTKEYLQSLDGVFNLRYKSERDEGIYDAMNKGIEMSRGQYIVFLNSGDIFTPDADKLIHELMELAYTGNEMFIFDALLNYNEKSKTLRRAKSGLFIYHSLPASHQAIIYPSEKLREFKYNLIYKVSGDYAITALIYKNGVKFRKMKGVLSEFSMGGVSTTNNTQLCEDARRVQLDILKMPRFLVAASYIIRLRTTQKTKSLYGKN